MVNVFPTDQLFLPYYWLQADFCPLFFSSFEIYRIPGFQKEHKRKINEQYFECWLSCDQNIV
jgi:hypothetical protein